MAVDKVSFAKYEIAKARCRVSIKTATAELALLEILQAAGGEIKAIALFEKLVIKFDDIERSPYELCKQYGYKPDEMIGLRSWQ
jgi:hypothetical protein